MSKIDLRIPLGFISPAACTYDEWLQIGMALCLEGYPYEIWEDWSRKDSERFHEGECAKKWKSFRGNPKPVTGATIVQMAKERGWNPKLRQVQDPDRALAWDDEISDNLKIIDEHYMDADKDIKEPDSNKWDGVSDIISYLDAVFHPGDIVSIVMQSFEREGGGYAPAGTGSYTITAGEYITRLKKYRAKGNDTNNTIGFAIGDYDHNAGAWVRFNPLDGKGVKNDNVSDFRYCLVESDSIPTGRQKALIEQLELPVAALVYSGGKSVHAIVHIDASSLDEYRYRVDYLYKVCTKNGLTVDGADRNPSRLSRLPGVWRKDHKQFLMGTHLGKTSYDEWKEWIEGVNDDLPDPEGLSDVWDDMPDLAPALIDNVLRMGHKMLLAGPSKAGKSFALIELCISIAEGVKWLQSFQCAQGRVLYVNLELDRASCLHRFKDVYRAMLLNPANTKNIDIWNLRGKAIPMDKLAPKLIRRAQKKDYTAVVIDPIYKIITGDENSADQMAHFCNQFDKVADEMKCAVIYCHHHSKGGQGMKRSIDRSSGSGVFARDPDAILDMIPLVTSDDRTPADKEADKAAGIVSRPTAFRITGTLREFPAFDPVNVWFAYPVHKLDDSGLLQFAPEEGSLEDIRAKGRKAGNAVKKAEKQSRVEEVDTAYEALSMGGQSVVTIADMASYFDVSEKSVRRYIAQNGNYECAEGKVFAKNNS